MNNKAKKHYSGGMSLVELIVVMAILSVVMMAVMSMYVPALQTVTVQTRVTDVQSNLRLAIERMTKDFLLAGFLVSDDPIIFESGISNDPSDLTLRTRLVVGGFGRVSSAVNGTGTVALTLSKADMTSFFPVNASVRVLNPIDMTEMSPYDESVTAQAQQHVYTVSTVAGSTITLTGTGVLNGLSNEEFSEAIVVRVRDNQQIPLQKVRYRVVGGNLERTVNGTNVQILARGINSVEFEYNRSATSGRINKVDITLQGQTEAYKGDSKIRQLRSSVALRNVF